MLTEKRANSNYINQADYLLQAKVLELGGYAMRLPNGLKCFRTCLPTILDFLQPRKPKLNGVCLMSVFRLFPSEWKK